MTQVALHQGPSKQDYETPPEFIDAVVARFGPIDFDLAANASNAKSPHWYGPGGILPNALTTEWQYIRGNAWLNPPFKKIEPWAEKCARSCPRPWETGRKILMLTPASVGANWFREWVHGQALVIALNGRISYVGQEHGAKGDGMLSVFGARPGFEVWNWRGNGDA